jgi:hypothetical protein
VFIFETLSQSTKNLIIAISLLSGVYNLWHRFCLTINERQPNVMSSSKAKIVLLVLGILIAVLIGFNAYGTTKVIVEKTETGLLPSIQKIKQSIDPKVITRLVKK